MANVLAWIGSWVVGYAIVGAALGAGTPALFFGLLLGIAIKVLVSMAWERLHEKDGGQPLPPLRKPDDSN